MVQYLCMNRKLDIKETIQIDGWGIPTSSGITIHQEEPLFVGDHITTKDWFAVLRTNPIQSLIYRKIRSHIHSLSKHVQRTRYVPQIIEIGASPGATIDLKRMLGRTVNIVTTDTVQMQMDYCVQFTRQHGVNVSARIAEDSYLPFPSSYADVIFVSDVSNFSMSLCIREACRVLKSGGLLFIYAPNVDDIVEHYIIYPCQIHSRYVLPSWLFIIKKRKYCNSIFSSLIFLSLAHLYGYSKKAKSSLLIVKK